MLRATGGFSNGANIRLFLIKLRSNNPQISSEMPNADKNVHPCKPSTKEWIHANPRHPRHPRSIDPYADMKTALGEKPKGQRGQKKFFAFFALFALLASLPALSALQFKSISIRLAE